MQNFLPQAPVAVVLNPHRPSLAPGVRRLRQADYQALVAAEQALQQAEQQARQVIGQADTVREQARQEGLQQGRAQARQEMLEAVTAMRGTLRRWVQETEPQLVDLVARCVREIVTHVDSQVLVRSSVERALAEMASAPDIRIQVHESDVAALREQLPTLIKQHDLRGMVRIEANATLQAGDCVLESPLGVIDLRVASQLHFVENTLKPT